MRVYAVLLWASTALLATTHDVRHACENVYKKGVLFSNTCDTGYQSSKEVDAAVQHYANTYSRIREFSFTFHEYNEQCFEVYKSV